MEEAEGTAKGTPLCFSGGGHSLVFDEQRSSHDGLCCTLPVGQGRIMAIVEKLGCSKANAVWVHQR